MKRPIILLIVGFMLAAQSSFAQDSARALPKNAVYIELGGNGILWSLSYERMYYQKDNIRLCGRIGCGIYQSSLFSEAETEIYFLPFVEANLLSGKRKGFFETGLGLTYFSKRFYRFTSESDYQENRYEFHRYYFIYRLGYRYQSKSGFMFRIAATAVIYFEPQYEKNHWDRFADFEFQPWGGISLGHSF